MDGMIVVFIIIIAVVYFCFMPKECDICGASLLSKRRKVFKVEYEGEKLNLCSNCNRALEKKISKECFDVFVNDAINLKNIDSAFSRQSTGVSVTNFVKRIQQPRGGFIKVKDMIKEDFTDSRTLLENENVSPIITGLAVDYLTRVIMFKDREAAFSVGLKGAALAGEHDNACHLLSCINGLDTLSVISACKLSGYDVVYRKGRGYFKGVDAIEPDNGTIQNIIAMVERAVLFFQGTGVIDAEITFEGGYSNVISSGDGDYLSKDTIWDMKVTKNEPNKDHTLQLLVYTMLLTNSHKYRNFTIKKIGVFNPRKNKSYTYDLHNLDKDTHEAIYNLIYTNQ
ncbi:hypothetical protein I5Q23_22825 [Serratia marcescens]|nr:hypothetical protein [Serratia marcescens]